MWFKTKQEAIEELREMAKPFARRIAPVFQKFDFTYYEEMELPSKEKLLNALNELIDYAEAADPDKDQLIQSGRFAVGYEYEQFNDEETPSWEPIMRMEIDADSIT